MPKPDEQLVEQAQMVLDFNWNGEYTRPGLHPYPHQCFLYLVDRKSTRLNSSHSQISYAVFCLKKKSSIRPLVALLREWRHGALCCLLLQHRSRANGLQHTPNDVDLRVAFD